MVGSYGHNTMQREGCGWNLTRKTSTCKKERLCQRVNAEMCLPSDSLHFSLIWAWKENHPLQDLSVTRFQLAKSLDRTRGFGSQHSISYRLDHCHLLGGACQQLSVNFTFYWGSPAVTLDFTISANKHSFILCDFEEKADVLWIWPFIPSLWTAGILFFIVIIFLLWVGTLLRYYSFMRWPSSFGFITSQFNEILSNSESSFLLIMQREE